MPPIEERVNALENDRTTARREHAALTELLAASEFGIHREFERMEHRVAKIEIDVKDIKTEMSEEFAHLKEDVSAILKILNEQFRKS